MKKSWLSMGLVVALSTMAVLDAPAQEPVYGGELTAALDLQPRSLDPVFGDADTIDRYLFNQIYEPLIRIDSEGAFVPILAESYAYAEDQTAIDFTLREGITV